jgi:hypothetical protein
MFEYYARFTRGLTGDPARLALPDVPVGPQREDLDADPNGPSPWDPCPCGRWGVCRADRHGCVAMCKELFPDLDKELDAWEAAHGWLYR